MALQGTLKDFALPDILQLIGIQRKTGLLTMEDGHDTVTVQFFEGQVVGADARTGMLEDRLGSVLVRTGRITEAQLQEALRIQRKTLQRLGYILVKSDFISEGELREALRVQITQIVYRLFRWPDGRYNFAPMDNLDYDRELTIPVSAETVLMEGARMIDEWPIIERRIRSPQAVFRKTEAGRALEQEAASAELADVASDVEFRLDLDGSAPAEPPSPEPGIRLSELERDVLRTVDGRANVQEVVDRLPVGEFDVYHALYDLLSRSLIEEIEAERDTGAERRAGAGKRLLGRIGLGVVAGAAVLSLMTLGHNPIAPWRAPSLNREAERLRAFASKGRLERLDRAVQTFYLDLGAVPEALDALALSGYASPRDLLDPWGRPYGYELAPDGYRLVGADAEGQPDEELAIRHRFSPTERMILEGPALSPVGPPERP